MYSPIRCTRTKRTYTKQSANLQCKITLGIWIGNTRTVITVSDFWHKWQGDSHNSRYLLWTSLIRRYLNYDIKFVKASVKRELVVHCLRHHFPRAHNCTSSRPTPFCPLASGRRSPGGPCGTRRRRSGRSTSPCRTALRITPPSHFNSCCNDIAFSQTLECLVRGEIKARTGFGVRFQPLMYRERHLLR